MNMPSRRLLALGAAALVSGCGFAMRGAQTYRFVTLHSGFVENSQFGNELRRALENQGVSVSQVASLREQQQVVLDVLQDQREKVVTASNSAGQTREFQLRVRVKLRVRSGVGRDLMPETELLATRDISFNETVVLAKEAEESLLYRDMQSDLVQQLLRRLAAVKL